MSRPVAAPPAQTSLSYLGGLRAAWRRMPPHGYFVGSAVFHYLGPAFAVLLFARVDPLGVAWLRIVSAAIVFAAWRKPWRRVAALDRETRRLLLALGVVFAVMNSCFYVAIDRLPLSTVAALEFLPVVLLAAFGVRSVRNGLALLLAVPGVYVLTDVRLASEPLGIAFAFANAALFALYIVLAHRISRSASLDRLDGLAAAMLVAAVAITPIGGWSAAQAVLDPVAIGAGLGVGVASSVIPYVCDQLAMARLDRATYSLMVSLLPATATVIGVVVLAQFPSWQELVGVALVVAAVGVHREPGAEYARPMEGPATPRPYRPPGWFDRNVFNRLVAVLTRLGVSIWGSRVIEVRGRTTGEPRRTPVNVLPLDGERYLVAPRGETQWVRNLRVAGEAELLLGRRRQRIVATEVADAEKVPILRAYLRRWKWEVGQFFASVGPDSSDDELARIAGNHPVFRIER